MTTKVCFTYLVILINIINVFCQVQICNNWFFEFYLFASDLVPFVKRDGAVISLKNI